jgi:hypothetical protein
MFGKVTLISKSITIWTIRPRTRPLPARRFYAVVKGRVQASFSDSVKLPNKKQYSREQNIRPPARKLRFPTLPLISFEFMDTTSI